MEVSPYFYTISVTHQPECLFAAVMLDSYPRLFAIFLVHILLKARCTEVVTPSVHGMSLTPAVAMVSPFDFTSFSCEKKI